MDSEKCSRRLRRGTTKRVACVVALLGAAVDAPAQQGDQDAAAPPVAAVLDAFLASVDQLSAQFRQETWTADHQLFETAVGRMALARPNRFYWHQEPPLETIVVADGEALWTYDVELAQVAVTRLDELATANFALLLAGDENLYESFEVVQTDRIDGHDWVKLVPRTANADFSSVRIGFSEGLPRQLELVDGLEQTTRIEFSDVVVDAEIDETLFEFDPPAGTDVIGDPD
jgi:outer membrane lipoprotein carrier protein